MTVALKSLERATCPFFRDSFNRLEEGCSVFLVIVLHRPSAQYSCYKLDSMLNALYHFCPDSGQPYFNDDKPHQ